MPGFKYSLALAAMAAVVGSSAVGVDTGVALGSGSTRDDELIVGCDAKRTSRRILSYDHNGRRSTLWSEVNQHWRVKYRQLACLIAVLKARCRRVKRSK